jgi:tetratricopeptide (TPR) repeat protein
MRLVRATVVLVALMLAAACAAPGGSRTNLGKHPVTSSMLLHGSPLLSAAGAQDPVAEVADENILRLTPEMIAFLDEHVDRDANSSTVLDQLLRALLGSNQFKLVYDDRTRTAQQTFRDRRGNCLSFTTLFIAMARNLGLDASYQEVEIPPDWSLFGQSFVLSRHVNVFLRLRHGETGLVDFNFYDRSTRYEGEVISDRRAHAHYFNNIGAEHMLAGDTPRALLNFFASIGEDRSFAPAWANLGVLYQREGYPEYAEAAYRAALQAERPGLAAMSNLANLYEQEGEAELAERYRERVRRHRMRNTYYRYYLASEAFASGEYSLAIRHLEHAIRQQRRDGRFYALLSSSHLMLGEHAAARRWMKKAAEVAERSSDRQRYQNKLDLLTGQHEQR